MKFVTAIIAVLILTSSSHAAELISLGPATFPWGVSGDGSTVVGRSGAMAFRWTRSSGIVSLGVDGSANAASLDGTVIVGQTSQSEAFRWTASTGVIGYGDLPGGIFLSQFQGISADGSVAVGTGNSSLGFEAMRWTEATGMVGLGDLAAGPFESQAADVSADGSVVVGSGHIGPDPDAFVWTQANGMVPLESSGLQSVATAVSANGRVVVGQFGSQPFRWTQEGGIVGLGHLTGEGTSGAHAVSADGSIVVGVSGAEAFIWTETSGMQSLETVLRALGVDVTGWNLYIPTTMSIDGTVIAGYGSNTQGSDQGWIAIIPEPSALALGFFGLLFVSLGCRYVSRRSST